MIATWSIHSSSIDGHFGWTIKINHASTSHLFFILAVQTIVTINIVPNIIGCTMYSAHTSFYESLPFFSPPKWHMTKTIKSFAKHMKMKIQHHSRQLSRSLCTVCSLDNAKSNAACGHFWHILTDPCNFVLCMIFGLLQLWRLIRMLNFVVSNYLSINFVFIKMLSQYVRLGKR